MSYVEVYNYAKIYPSFVRVIKYNRPLSTSVPSNNVSYTNSLESDELDQTSLDDSLTKSINRTKTKISDLILCNDFDIFATFTLSPQIVGSDRYDFKKAKQIMSNFLKVEQQNLSRKMGFKFGYIVIPEKHKDGAYHFHVLFKDYPKCINFKNKTILLLDEFYSNNNSFATVSEKKSLKLKNKYFFFTRFNYGRSQCEFIRDRERVSSYVKKYITKDLCTDPYAKRYFCSRDLLRPVVVYNMFPNNSSQFYSIDPYLVTDFFKIYDIYYADYPSIKSSIDVYRLKVPPDSLTYIQSSFF